MANPMMANAAPADDQQQAAPVLGQPQALPERNARDVLLEKMDSDPEIAQQVREYFTQHPDELKVIFEGVPIPESLSGIIKPAPVQRPGTMQWPPGQDEGAVDPGMSPGYSPENARAIQSVIGGAPQPQPTSRALSVQPAGAPDPSVMDQLRSLFTGQ